MSALVTGIYMTAENGRPAILDCMQNLQGIGIQQLPVLFDKLLSVHADNISHLARRLFHHGSRGGRLATASNGLTVF